MDQDSAHIVAASKVPMLKLGEFELWRMRIEQYIQMIDYSLWEVIENGATLPKTQLVKGVMTVMPITSVEDKAQRRLEMLDQTFDRLQKLVSQLELLGEKLSQEDVNKKLLKSLSPEWNTHAIVWRNKADLDTMSMDDLYNNLKVSNEAVTVAHGVTTASTQCRAPRNQDNKKESSRRSVPVETSTSTALGSCDGLGGYDWSDQAEEGPNYALMAYSSSSPNSEVSNDSNCSISCMETIKLLKSQNDQLLRDLEKSSLMVLGEITIGELRKKLEKLQKEKDNIQFNVDIFENASESLNKLIECQIVDNYKKGLGYEKYNAVPPPYIGNFMSPTPNLSFTGLNEFVNKLVVQNKKSDEDVSKVVGKSDDSSIIEDWMSDSEEENVSQPKTKKKTIKPSIVKIEFVKPKQQEKTTRKTVKQTKKHRHMTGNMSYLTDYEEIDGGYVAFGGNPKGGNITGKEAVNTACYVQNRVLVVKPHNKTPYELFLGRTPTLSFMRPFGCPVTILNTIDSQLGQICIIRIVEENLHISFSESTPNVAGSRPDWLFNIDALTRTMNYEPIVTGTQSNSFAGTKASYNAGQVRKETRPVKDYILLPLWTADPPFSQDLKSSHNDGSKLK
ncbi:hypothetical protein Tco_0683770 [Tanacetum coccineum]